MRGLAAIFCPLVLLWSLVSCFVVPAFQAPDEQTQLLRAVQVSKGGLVGVRVGSLSGGVIPSNMLLVLGAFGDLPGHPERKASMAEWHRYDTVPWGGVPFMISYPNTVTYGPVCYLPQALGVWIGQRAGLSILRTLYLARVLAALAFVALATVAVAICRRGTLFLALVLALPMTVFLAGSVSQDGVMLASCGLLAAALTRMGSWSGSGPAWRWAMLGVGFGLLGMAKPPCVILSALALVVASRPQWRAAALCPLVAVGLTAAWLLVGVIPLKVTLQPHGNFSDAAQVRYLLHHVGAIPGLIGATLQRNWWLFYTELIGRLGWLDTLLPHRFYELTGAVLALAWLASAMRGRMDRIMAARVVAIVAIFVVYAVGLLLSIYVTWSEVGAPVIEGVQGRYFLPPLLFAVCALPADAPAIRRSGRVLPAGFAVWVAASAAVTVAALHDRFW